MNLFEFYSNRLFNLIFGLRDANLSTAQKQNAKIVAHRGVHGKNGAIENTLNAFDLALQNNIWGVELDIRWTADWIPVVLHDTDLLRVFGKSSPPINEMSGNQLNQLESQIPKLADVVDRFGKKLHLMIELKDPLRDAQQKEALQGALASLQPGKDYHLLSLQADILDTVDWLPPRCLVDIAWRDMEASLTNAIQKNHGGITGHFVLLTEGQKKRAQTHHLKTGTGFIESKGCLYREIARGIDWVFTDTPLQLKAFLK